MAKALVIDDNREAADSVCQMLKFFGIEPVPAYGPRAAMVHLRDWVPDIVFLDINMPGVDGFEVTAYIRRFPNMAGVPVVYVTSDDQPQTAQKASKTGALLMIIKPATMDTIEGALKKAGLL